MEEDYSVGRSSDHIAARPYFSVSCIYITLCSGGMWSNVVQVPLSILSIEVVLCIVIIT